MEQQTQQPIQEEKIENKPPIKTNWKSLAIVVVLAVLVGGGAVFILLQIFQPRLSQPQLLPKYPKQYILQILSQDQSCTVDSDCVIVGTECGDCECGAPINKINQAKYERQYEELCRDYRGGFCDFLCQTPFARCVHNKCTLSSVSPKADLTKDWQTYRNDEFGFEVRYPPTVTARDWAGTPHAGKNIELSVHFGINNEDITSPDAVVIQIEKGTSLNDLYTEAGREILFKSLFVNSQEFKEVTVGQGSYKAIKLEYDKKLSTLGKPLRIVFMRYFIDHNGILYQITYYPGRDTAITREVFDQILSTFRFVE